MAAGSFVRIFSLLWADILVAYALFVMQNYLTDVWKLSFIHSAGLLNVWGGLCSILPVFFLFLVDAILGNFMMLVLSSIAYSVGIAFISMSTPPVLGSSTGMCKQYDSKCIGHTQKVLFYTGMALVAVGIAGHLVSIHPFLEEQKENPDDNKLKIKSVFQLPGFLLVVLIPIIGAIALPYIKPWSIRFGIPAICTLAATLLFLSGWCTYEKKPPQGSPLTNVCRVFVAFSCNIWKPYPTSTQLYKKDDRGPQSFPRTRFLRCLEKAAIDAGPEDPAKNRWKHCSLAEVEEAKIAVRMVPMWMTFVVCGIVSSIANTYFLEQANHMNRRIGKWNVPIPIFLLLSKFAKFIFGLFADCLLSTSKKYAAPVGIVVAMTFSVLCCITAARIEFKRLNVIISNGLLDKPADDIPMSVYWLLFQFILLAGLDSFFDKSVEAFYDNQAPDSMKNYLKYFTKGVSGLGFICSVLSVFVVGKISERGGKTNWFQFTLNRSRLDKYYWVLAGMSAVNLVVFIFVASFYRYKNPEAKEEEQADAGTEQGEAI